MSDQVVSNKKGFCNFGPDSDRLEFYLVIQDSESDEILAFSCPINKDSKTNVLKFINSNMNTISQFGEIKYNGNKGPIRPWVEIEKDILSQIKD